MKPWIDLYDTSNKRIGSGPIRTATNVRIKRALDRSAEFGFAMSAADSKQLLIEEKFRAQVRAVLGGSTISADGIVDQFDLEWSRENDSFSFGGMDVLQELTYDPLIDGLQISETQWLSPNMVQSEGPITTNLTLAIDGNPATFNTVTFPWLVSRYIYCVHSNKYPKVHFVLGANKNAQVRGFHGQYFKDQVSGWQDLTITSNTTVVSGAPFAQTGDIVFDLPAEWSQTTNGGYYGYIVRFWADLGMDDVDFAEVTVWAEGPTYNALTAIAAYLPANWTLAGAPYHTTTATPVYHRFDERSNTTILAGFIWIANATGEHFRLGENLPDGTHVLEWLGTDTPSSGVRAVDGYSPKIKDNVNAVIITSLTRTKDSADKYNCIKPFATGFDELAVDLANATWTAPVGYTLSKVNNYIEVNGASPRITRCVEFEDVGSVDPAGVLDKCASDQLARMAFVELVTHQTTPEFYKLSVTGLRKLLKPGETIRVVHKRVRYGVVVVNIDATLLILSVAYSFGDGGLTAELEVSSVSRYPVNDATIAALLTQTSRNTKASKQPVSERQIRSALGKAGIAAGAGTSGQVARQAVFTQTGATTPGAIGIREPNELAAQTITTVRLDVDANVVGADVVVDVYVDGTPIFDAGNRPAISAGNKTFTTTSIDYSSMPLHSILTAECISAGTAVNLSVCVVSEGAM